LDANDINVSRVLLLKDSGICIILAPKQNPYGKKKHKNLRQVLSSDEYGAKV